MYKRILVAVDGSKTSDRALAAAIEHARESGGCLRLLHSLDELAMVTGMETSGELVLVARANANKVLEAGLAMARSAGVPADARLNDAPAQRLGPTVAEEAQRWEADLVVTGTHGRRGLGRVLLGSGAEQIIRHAPVPVLVIRGQEEG